MSKKSIYLFSDGGAINNGKKGAKACYSILFTTDKTNELYKYNKTKLIKDAKKQSNNTAELTGIKHLIKIIKKEPILFNEYKKIYIVTDSMYSINCLIKWRLAWEKNNWLTKNKKPVKNDKLIKKIVNYLDNSILKNRIEFLHVRSHTKEPNDENTIEYLLWQGNYIVDKNIQNIFKKE